MKPLLAPILWILGFQLIAGGIGFVTSFNMGWYNALTQSPLAPPGFVFPIVWTALYVMLALAAWLMWERCREPSAYRPFRLFWVQMLLNWGWSFVFFGFHMIEFGFYWIVALDLAMLAFIISAWAQHRVAALLVLPTLIWGSFAAYLNYAIWVLN